MNNNSQTNLEPTNEDEFGIIVDEDHKFTSIENAGNYVGGLKEKLKNKASMEEFPITTAFPEDRKRYLLYCVSLMNRSNLPFVEKEKMLKCRAVIGLLVSGYTFPSILGWLRKNGFPTAKLPDLIQAQKDGMEMIKDAIVAVKSQRTPIIGLGQ